MAKLQDFGVPTNAITRSDPYHIVVLQDLRVPITALIQCYTLEYQLLPSLTHGNAARNQGCYYLSCLSHSDATRLYSMTSIVQMVILIIRQSYQKLGNLALPSLSHGNVARHNGTYHSHLYHMAMLRHQATYHCQLHHMTMLPDIGVPTSAIFIKWQCHHT